jgi:hypothetical protein
MAAAFRITIILRALTPTGAVRLTGPGTNNEI